MQIIFASAPAPKSATPKQLEGRYWARVHGVHFSGPSVDRVFDMIATFEERRNRQAASYIVNDIFDKAA